MTRTLALAPGGAAPPAAAKLPARPRPAPPGAQHARCGRRRPSGLHGTRRGGAGLSRGGRRSRPCPSPPPPPPRWVRKRRAGPGRWMPLVAKRSPAPRAPPGSRGRRPPPLPGLCSPPRGRGSQPQQLGSPFPTRGILLDRGWELWTPLVKSRVGCLHYRKGCDLEMLDPRRKTGA